MSLARYRSIYTPYTKSGLAALIQPAQTTPVLKDTAALTYVTVRPERPYRLIGLVLCRPQAPSCDGAESCGHIAKKSIPWSESKPGAVGLTSISEIVRGNPLVRAQSPTSSPNGNPFFIAEMSKPKRGKKVINKESGIKMGLGRLVPILGTTNRGIQLKISPNTDGKCQR